MQYRETDFNFVSRLLEHEGIFYFFHHENGRHTAVFGDAPSAFREGERANVSFVPEPAWEQVHGWHHAYKLRPGRWTLTDYDFKKPQTDLTADRRTIIDNAVMKKFEFFDSRRLHRKGRRGSLARTRIEMEEATYHVVNGFGKVPSFRSGETFTLKDHPITEEMGATYALLSVHHYAQDTSYFSEDGQPGTYSNSFVGLPAETGFRPPQVTPCPVVHGPQTATVVGPNGEEIYTDEYGRVKVQFRWDRYGKADENSSMFLRLVQNWAGNKWGAQILPRIGMEVCCRVSRRRSGSAHRDGLPEQCGCNAARQAPRQPYAQRIPDPVEPQQQRLQRDFVRGQGRQRATVHARRTRRGCSHQA